VHTPHMQDLGNHAVWYTTYMTKKRSLLLLAPAVFLLPTIVLAQDTTWIETAGDEVLALADVAVYVLAALAFVLFLWGGILFILHSDNELQRAQGKKRMMWGVVGLVVLMGVWGFVSILQVLTGIEGEDVVDAPQVEPYSP